MQASKSTPRLRLVGVLAVVAATASLVFVAPASAQDEQPPDGVEIVRVRPDGKTVYRGPQSRIYDNMVPPDGGDTTGYAVIAGGDMYDVCLERAPQPTAKALYFSRGDTWVAKSLPAGIEVYTSVYRTDLEIFAFFDATCGAFFESGTPIPPPFATGMTTLRFKARGIRDLNDFLDPMSPQPRGRYDNGVVGEVADADGVVYDLVTVADFAVRANGQPDFFELSVSVTPQAA